MYVCMYVCMYIYIYKNEKLKPCYVSTSDSFWTLTVESIGKMRVILWTIVAIVSSIANGKFLLWQNEYNFAYRAHECTNLT